MTDTSCGDIAASLAALQSAIAGIGAATDAKIAPLLARINALEAALGKAPQTDQFIKLNDFDKLLLAALGGTISFATKDELAYWLKVKSSESAEALSKANQAIKQSADGVDAKRLVYEEKVRRTQLEFETNALKNQINKLPNDSQLANELKARVAAVESKAAKVEFETAAVKAENIKVKGEVTSFRTELNLAAKKADDAIGLGTRAMAKADNALGGLKNLASKFGDDIAKLGAKFAGQFDTLAGMIGKFAPLLALLGIVSTLLDVAQGAATLLVLGSRLDAIEAAQDRMSADMSTIYTNLGLLKSKFEKDLQRLYEIFAARSNEILQELYDRLRGLKPVGLEALQSQVTNLSNQFNSFQGSLIPTIDNRISSFLAGLGLGAIAARLTNVENATKNMPQCRYSPVLDQQALAQAQANNKISLGMQAFNTAQMQSVQNKLGAQLPGGLSAAATKIINGFNSITNLINSSFSKTWKFLKLDRVLNVLTFAASLHNALMLSRSLGETLLDVTSSVLAAIGLRDANGSPFDLQEFFGKQFEELIIGIVGQEAYEGNKAKWNAANRIISSAANLLWSVQSMIYNAIEGIEIIGGWIAKMANGLKFEGIVSDNSWGFFNPNPNFKNPIFKAMEKLDDLEDAASQIYMISNNVIDFQETASQLDEQKKEIAKAISDYQTLANTEFNQSNTDSGSPDISNEDLIDGRELEDN